MTQRCVVWSHRGTGSWLAGETFWEPQEGVGTILCFFYPLPHFSDTQTAAMTRTSFPNSYLLSWIRLLRCRAIHFEPDSLMFHGWTHPAVSVTTYVWAMPPRAHSFLLLSVFFRWVSGRITLQVLPGVYCETTERFLKCLSYNQEDNAHKAFR